MRTFACQSCGQPVYFENVVCNQCGVTLVEQAARLAGRWCRSMARAWLVLALSLCVCTPVGATQAPANMRPTVLPPPATATASTSPDTPTPIPVESIAPSATEVSRLLRQTSAELAALGEIQTISEALPLLGAQLQADLERDLRVLDMQTSLEGLQTQEQYWSSRQADLRDWLTAVSDRVMRLQETLSRIDALEQTWTLTGQKARESGAPDTILQQIDETLADLAAAKPPYRARWDAILNLQGQIAREIDRCETARSRILAVQQDNVTGALAGVLANQRRPLWDRDLLHQAAADLPQRLSQVAATYQAQIREYLTDPIRRLPLHLGLFTAVLVALLLARWRVRQWAAAGDAVGHLGAILDRPVSTALFLGLTLITSLVSPAPPAVKELLGTLLVVPLIVLARALLPPPSHPVLYTLGALFALDRVRHTFLGTIHLVDQSFIFLESLAGLATLTGLVLHLRSRARENAAAWNPYWLWRLLVSAVLLLLSIGLIASLGGNLALARLTTPAVLIGGATALWLYVLVEVAMAGIGFALRIWPLTRLNLVCHHRDILVARIRLLFIWIALLGWGWRFLNYLGLWETVRELVDAALDARLTLGSLTLSVGDMLAFVLTLTIGYLLSTLLRVVLEEDVYPRTEIPKGISYAVSSLLHYGIAVLAFFIGLGFLGISLTQVTLFAGALGVGIGLGLQSLVHNFVSGLILLFEQPIQIGNVIQVGELQGTVRRVGIRASVVRTVQGAEIIIPNSDLTSQQVTNWTLSDRHRRIDLPVGLSYGSDPRQVIDLLQAVACDHPKILVYPPPIGLFMGYGDSAINFELRVWTEQEGWLTVRSELATLVYEAVYAAGLSFPFPQREVRILTDGIPPSGPMHPSR